MTLSATADYALRAVLVLARARTHADPRNGRRARTADELAAATGAPRNYLSKTLHALARAGLVTSARGPQGGFVLARHPAELTVAQVVDLFDVPRPQTRCLLGSGPCDPERPCAAHHRWLALVAARRDPLAATTLAALVGGPEPVGAAAASRAPEPCPLSVVAPAA